MAAPVDGPWRVFALFDPHGACVAAVETALLTLGGDGRLEPVGAIRNVAVDLAWRGRGLFRALVDAALRWQEAEHTGTALLYTAEPGLYRRFGFAEGHQHAFVGPAPPCEAGPAARRLDLDRGPDVAILHRLYADRAPLSAQCALHVDWPLFLANLRKDGDVAVAFCTDLEAAIAFEHAADGTLVIVDVVAACMPTLAQVLGRIAPPVGKVTTRFPPDCLRWSGRPVADDTGLMIRGPRPAAMARPFMLPPTVEF